MELNPTYRQPYNARDSALPPSLQTLQTAHKGCDSSATHRLVLFSKVGHEAEVALEQEDLGP